MNPDYSPELYSQEDTAIDGGESFEDAQRWDVDSNGAFNEFFGTVGDASQWNGGAPMLPLFEAFGSGRSPGREPVDSRTIGPRCNLGSFDSAGGIEADQQDPGVCSEAEEVSSDRGEPGDGTERASQSSGGPGGSRDPGRTRKRKRGIDSNVRDGEKAKPGNVWFITVPAVFTGRSKKDKALKKATKEVAFAQLDELTEELLVAAEEHELHIFLKFINPLSFEELNELCEDMFFKHCNLEKPRNRGHVIKYCSKTDWKVIYKGITSSELNASHRLMDACEEMAMGNGFDCSHSFIRQNIKYINCARSICASMMKNRIDDVQAALALNNFNLTVWMVDFLEWLSKPPHVRSKAYYLYGSPETYKTTFVMHALRQLKLSVCFAESSGNWAFQSYKGEKAIFMNDFDMTQCKEELLLNVLENQPCMLPVKASAAQMRCLPTYNIITSNKAPEQLEWSAALRTRIHVQGTDFAMVKVEPEVQTKWLTWLQNGGRHVSSTPADDVVCLDSSEDEEAEEDYGDSPSIGEIPQPAPEGVDIEPELLPVPRTPTWACQEDDWSPPDPGYAQSEVDEEELVTIDLTHLTSDEEEATPKKRSCVYVLSECEER